MKSNLLGTTKALLNESIHWHNWSLAAIFSEDSECLRIKGFGIGGKKDPALVQIIFVGEGLVSQCVAQRQKQKKVGERKLWAVLWVYEHIPAQLKLLPAGEVCNVRYGVNVRKDDGAVFCALPLNLTSQTIQLLAVQLSSDVGVWWLRFKQQRTFAVQPDWQHDHFSMEPRLGYFLRRLIGWAPRPTALHFAVQSWLLISW